MGAVLAFQPMAWRDREEWVGAVMTSPATPGEKLVAWALSKFHNEKSGQCNPSAQTIAARIGLTLRGVQKALAGLEARGFIRVLSAVRRGGSNGYILERLTNAVRIPDNPNANTVPAECEHGSADCERGSHKPLEQDLNMGAGGAARNVRVIEGGRDRRPSQIDRLRAAMERIKGASWVRAWLSEIQLSASGDTVRVVAKTAFVRDRLDGTDGIDFRKGVGQCWPGAVLRVVVG